MQFALPGESLNRWPAPQGEHTEAWGAAKYPTPHFVDVLEPSHELPAVHGKHWARVFPSAAPPLV